MLVTSSNYREYRPLGKAGQTVKYQHSSQNDLMEFRVAGTIKTTWKKGKEIIIQLILSFATRSLFGLVAFVNHSCK